MSEQTIKAGQHVYHLLHPEWGRGRVSDIGLWRKAWVEWTGASGENGWHSFIALRPAKEGEAR